MKYSIYVTDIESTGLDPVKNDIIELSLIRLSDGEQKTWFVKPVNVNNIDDDALRVNGHKREDILHNTKEGRELYKSPSDVLIEVENWVLEDGVAASERVLAGQNTIFDKIFLQHMWSKLESDDSFPFSRRVIDTMAIEFFFDMCKGNYDESYSLNNICKKYGVKNEKAHSAAADAKATKEVLELQVDWFKSKIG